ncbi:nucleotidyltransferase family protein [Plectonema cf. radiosum LEGE 06105]|uniref:Nucleotidyltransferase family protein n=1 Tax=Plectonema cf. radiosum LEGE 06105 TaxID=945769 RepID=A0A8J7K2I5_9CYAN|nr:nucleotidyltransferase family protein [Plectonema radiosum]MBE9213102.1 nucleotidyltransferase family protein [Plectonema cf. radiosum LEGE 06105]
MKTLSKLDTKNQLINTCPEIELLLSCLNPDINNAITERIKTLIKQNIDWQYLTQTADRHGVLSLVYSRLNNICPQALPESVLNQWRRNFQYVAQRNLFLTGELVNLLKLLKEKNIVALPYKGPILASLIYKNVALRRFGDLDIIVQEKDIFAVRELLIAQGYLPKIEMTDAELVKYLNSKTEHTYDFIHNDKNVFLEIHWRIAPKYITPIAAKDLWEDLEPFSLAGTTINNLPLECWLPILCVHGSRHMWERLSWLCDIATLIHKNPDINWEKVVQKANLWGCQRMLFLGLFMSHELFGVDLPPEIWQQMKKVEPIIKGIVPQVYQQLFAEVRTSDKFMGRTFYHIQVRERLNHKILYIQSFLYWLVKGKKELGEG